MLYAVSFDYPASNAVITAMSKLTLTFLGPESRARAALVGLLHRFPGAYFVEKDTCRYEVTAEDAVAREIAGLEGWQAQFAGAAAR